MKISVIIPIYNTEKHLNKCLDSVLSQTYHDFEIIVINDGSPDNSLKILKSYEAKHNNIKVFSQKNSGVSEARNLGIKKAKGEYIVFIDSDDYVSPNYLEDLIRDMQQNPCDLIIHGFDKVSFINDETIETIIPSAEARSVKLSTPLDVLSNENSIFFKQGYPISKLFKRKIVLENNIKFPKGINIYEDTVFLLQYLYHCKSVYLNNIANYRYTLNENSLSNSSRSFKKTFDSLNEITQTVDELYLKSQEKQFDIHKYSESLGLIATYVNDAIISVYINIESKKERKNLLSQFSILQKKIYQKNFKEKNILFTIKKNILIGNFFSIFDFIFNKYIQFRTKR